MYAVPIIYRQTNTNKLNKTCTLLLQPNGGNIVFMRKSLRILPRGTQNVNTHNRKTHKTEMMSNTDLTKKTGGELRSEYYNTFEIRLITGLVR